MSEAMCYVAHKSCGCLTLVTVDSPEHAKEVAKEIAKAVRLGETVDRVPVEQARTMPFKCAEHGGGGS